MPIWTSIKTKLHSQQGASLTMALFLFLVCALVASVVIVAATAASGRQAELEKIDKSYYNVTSAAGLFWDELSSTDASGRTVTVVRECDMTEEDSGNYTLSNWSASIDDDFVTDQPSQPLTNTSATLFQILAYDMVFGGTVVSGNKSLTASRALSESVVEGSIDTSTLENKNPHIHTSDITYDSFDITSSDNSFAPVKVDAAIKANNGDLSLVFAEKTNKTSYKCTATASVDIDDMPCAKRQTGPNTYHLTWTTKVVWDAGTLQIGGGQNAA